MLLCPPARFAPNVTTRFGAATVRSVTELSDKEV